MNEDKKDVEIVDGDGSNLNISHVYNHINPGKPKCDEDKPKNIIVPKPTKEPKESNKKQD